MEKSAPFLGQALLPEPAPEVGDAGFMLLTAIVMVFLVLLTLSIAAPRMAREIQRDREQESAHRAEQYVRAIRIYYLKFHRYPTSIEQLEKTNNQRFLRQKYVDPLTGKDDWRLIHVGENQTTVKGFFGDDLPGLPAMQGGGLGSASNLASTTGGGGSAFNNSGAGGSGGSAFNNSGAGGSSSPGGSSTFGGSSSGLGQTGQSSGTSGTGTTGSSSTGSSGIQSQDATTFGGGGGPIIGVGSQKSGSAMLVVNEQTTYESWEFLYDPRIEQLYAKANLMGGISSGSGTTGFGTSTPGSNGTSVGTPIGTPIGGNPTTPTGTPAPSTGTPQ